MRELRRCYVPRTLLETLRERPAAIGSRRASRRARWLAVGLALVAGSCTSTRRLRSSLYVPCRAKEITVSAETSNPGEDTWIASCRGRDYACSATAVGNKVSYRCKPCASAAQP